MSKAITNYWYAHYCAKFCTLCGNSGKIDTRGVRTAAGVECGRINFCICPNGQRLRQYHETIAADGARP